MKEGILLQSIEKHMAQLGYKHSAFPGAMASPGPAAEKTYQVKIPADIRDFLHVDIVYINGRIPYKNKPTDETFNDITWIGTFTPAAGIRVTSIDAMVAPTAILTGLSSPTTLRPRVTFKAGAMDPDDPEQSLEDLMPLLEALERIIRQG